MNKSGLIPLKYLNTSFHIDLWFSDANKIFRSTDTAINYICENLELLYDAISSPSIDQYFSTNTVSMNALEYEHVYRVVNVGSTKVNIQLPSNRTNCSGVVSFFRNQADLADVTVQKLAGGNVPMTAFEETDMKINTRTIYQEARGNDGHADDWYKEASHLSPELQGSKYFTSSGWEGSDFVVCANLSGAPSSFHKRFLSGVRTSNLTTDPSQEIKFAAPTTALIQVDSYVISNVVCTYSKVQMNVTL